MPKEDGSKEHPWLLKTPPQTSEYNMHRDEKDGRPILVCTAEVTHDARGNKMRAKK